MNELLASLSRSPIMYVLNSQGELLQDMQLSLKHIFTSAALPLKNSGVY